MSGQLDEDPRPRPLSPESGPTALRITLGSQLRRLRETLEISREAAGEAIRASQAKISRLELGRVGFQERDVADLLTLYKVTDPTERERFLELARQANVPGWWHQYSDLLPSWFETYLGLEEAAESIRCYGTQLIPGLLQTEDYARAVVRLGQVPARGVEGRVAVRMRRQRVLSRPDCPKVWAVIDEGVLRRLVGGPDVLRGQLDHLITAAKDWSRVTIQVLPNAVGSHPTAGGPFTILRFPEAELPDIVYIEQLTSALYLDRREDLERYMAVMDQLSVQAKPPERTVELLTAIRDEI